ncbi:MAG: chorismate mutase [Henriciella sp.]
MSHSDISPTTPDDAMAQLQRLRASIDNLDAILLHTLAERFKVTHAVGVLKAKNDLPPADKAREQKQIERLRHLASISGLDPAFAEKFLNFIVVEVIRHHEQLREEDPTTKQNKRNSKET